jgi:hypothetical protein
MTVLQNREGLVSLAFRITNYLVQLQMNTLHVKVYK